MVVHELPSPAVWESDMQAEYGGNQEWFSRVFQRTASCASITGVNLAAYYTSRTAESCGLYSGDTKQFSRSEYLRVMEEVYRYTTPGSVGFPVAGWFVQKLLQFAREHGSTFRAHTMFYRCGCEERIVFLKEAIAKGNPAAFLVLRRRAPEMRENNRHWVTIVGWIGDAGDEQVTVSNCGEREMYQAEMLLENHRGNVLRMVWLSHWRQTEKSPPPL